MTIKLTFPQWRLLAKARKQGGECEIRDGRDGRVAARLVSMGLGTLTINDAEVGVYQRPLHWFRISAGGNAIVQEPHPAEVTR